MSSDQVVMHPASLPPQVSFDRRELMVILDLYSRFVAAGVGKDYAIDHLRDCAVFSIFRRAAETPMFRIEKRPKDARRQGAYSVVAMDGQTLKRGQDLKTVLKILERKLIKAVD
ncbi:MAG: DUF2794 domain-containing protein [Pseudomonadota bacterium]